MAQSLLFPSWARLRAKTGLRIMVKTSEDSRIAWVDYAKGICIILVVMMHSTLGVEKATGTLTWLHPFIDWARPFRMPDFFMISGLFLASRINKDWRTYLDSKVLHFAYFYVLWMTIQSFTKDISTLQNEGFLSFAFNYLQGFYEPYGTLWFIYLLAIFFVVTKALVRVPPLVIFTAAALLEIAPVETGHTVIDEFASRYVYFFAGYWLAKYILQFADGVKARTIIEIAAGLSVWAIGNYVLVHTGYAALPIISLVLGFIGAGAVVSAGVFLSKTNMAHAIRYCGQNSIVIYLSFSLFMAAMRTSLLKYAPSLDLGAASLLATSAGVIGPILLFWATRNTKLSFLFIRPEWAKLEKPAKRWHSVNYVKQLNSETR
jgi:uncharacterized membrane protein YcfT